jgi:hypothetical protein
MVIKNLNAQRPDELKWSCELGMPNRTDVLSWQGAGSPLSSMSIWLDKQGNTTCEVQQRRRENHLDSHLESCPSANTAAV